MLTRKERLRKIYKSTWQKLVVREHRAIPVFILGEMRSGTNMLTDCLDRCLATDTYNENNEHAFDAYALRDDSTIVDLVSKSRATHVVFKSLADSSRALELLELFPNSKAVWIFRNYEDVVNSAIKKWKEHNTYLAYILHDPATAAWRGRNLPDALVNLIRDHYERGIDDTSARALIWYVRNRLFFEQRLDSNARVRLIRYENLAQEPKREFQRVFDFLELPLHDSYLTEVSTRSIRRDPAPVIDAAIERLCDGLFEDLKSRLEAQNLEL